MSVIEHTRLEREQPDAGWRPVFRPAISWDTHYSGTQFGNSYFSTPKREFLSSMAFQEYLAFFHPLPLALHAAWVFDVHFRNPVTDPSSNKIPFGLRDGRMVEVSEVESGLACRCVCPSCGQPLQARKGPIRTHYFAHDPSDRPSISKCSRNSPRPTKMAAVRPTMPANLM